MLEPIPLICDRCRVSGAAGDDPFALHADLLDFEPVPRRPRADGWDGEVQATRPPCPPDMAAQCGALRT